MPNALARRAATPYQKSMAEDLTIGLSQVAAGGKVALARALVRLEAGPGDPAMIRLLDEAHHHARAQVIGLTGPPGVGKSSLLSRLARAFRHRGQTVGIVAVDPSSRRTGGALLGDRARLETDPDDMGLFVRSMAARDRLGGLAHQTAAAVTLMRALFDLVIVETVGVGQSETDVADLADTVIFCIQPSSGDSLQFMKAGIMEVPHIAVVTKADLGPAALRAQSDALGALSLSEAEDPNWTVPVLTLSALNDQGVQELIGALDRHWQHLAGAECARRRQARDDTRLAAAIKDRFGREGLMRLGTRVHLRPGESPARAEERCARLLTATN